MTTNGNVDTLPNVTYGFIGELILRERPQIATDRFFPGIGAMGFPMAQQLRAKIPKSSTLIIREVVESQIKKFMAETKAVGLIKVAESARAVAEEAVRSIT
jgi:hypothetical protein